MDIATTFHGIGSTLTLLIGLLHVWILVLEMLLWRQPLGRRVFRLTEQMANDTATLAMNQGLYNGFLAAGLLWAVMAPPPLEVPLKLFFLLCVLVAGLFGSATVGKRILFVQALPAAVALAAVMLGRV